MAHQEGKILDKAVNAGFFAKLFLYSKLNGPGTWLCLLALSAGSLVGSIGLGQFLGTDGIWVQVLAMVLGFFSLWAVSHITLNSQQSLFLLLKNDWNSSLAWWFAAAALVTNFAWCMPQFRFGAEISSSVLLPFLDNKFGKICAAVLILGISVFFSFWYQRSGIHSKLFQWSLRSILFALTSLLILCFCLVLSRSELTFHEILSGFIPSFSDLIEVHPRYHSLLSTCGDMRLFWENHFLGLQKNLILITFSSTIGINLLFALPLLLLGRNWRREHNGFSKFNLFTGLLIPFIICSFCLVVLSAIVSDKQFKQSEIILSQNPPKEILEESNPIREVLKQRVIHEVGSDAYAALAPFQQDELLQSIPAYEQRLATLSVTIGVKSWIESLVQIGGTPLRFFLGIIVLFISVSTIILLMIINGHLICEVLGRPHKGALFQSGSLLLAVSSVGPFVWTDQDQWVADPTYFISLAIIPFAFLSIIMIMNNREILGRECPRGWSGFLLNFGNILSLALLGSCSLYTSWNHSWGFFPVGKFLSVIIAVVLFAGYFSLKIKKLNNRISGLESLLKSK